MVKKYYFSVLIFFWLSGCVGSPAKTVDVVTSSPVKVSTSTAVPIPASVTPLAKLTLKQKDLIFIEFFAVT